MIRVERGRLTAILALLGMVGKGVSEVLRSCSLWIGPVCQVECIEGLIGGVGRGYVEIWLKRGCVAVKPVMSRITIFD